MSHFYYLGYDALCLTLIWPWGLIWQKWPCNISCVWFFFLALHLSLVGNSGHLTWVKLQQSQEQCYSFVKRRAVVSCVQTKVWLPVLGLFNICLDVNVCDCTQGLYGHHKRACTKNWLGENIPGHIRESNLPQQHACLTLPAELHACHSLGVVLSVQLS